MDFDSHARWTNRRFGIGARLLAVVVLPVLLATFFGLDAARFRFEALDGARDLERRTTALVTLAQLRSDALDVRVGELATGLLPDLIAQPMFEADFPTAEVLEPQLDALAEMDLDGLTGLDGSLDDLRRRVAALQVPVEMGSADVDPETVIDLGYDGLQPAIDFVRYVDGIADRVEAGGSARNGTEVTPLAVLAHVELHASEESLYLLGELTRGYQAGRIDVATASHARAAGILVDDGLAEFRTSAYGVGDSAALVAVESAERRWTVVRERFALTAGLPFQSTDSGLEPYEFGIAPLAEVGVTSAELATSLENLRRTVGADGIAAARAEADRARADLQLGVVVAVIALAVALSMAAVFVPRLRSNLLALHRRALDVSSGSLDGDPLALPGNDETALLGHAFDTMAAAVADRLHSSESFASGLLATTDEAILTIDADGRITTANAAAQSLLGVPATELIGMHSSAVSYRFPLLAGVSSGLTNVDGVVLRPDATTRSVVVTTRDCGSESAPMVAVFARDLTERQRLHERLAHQATHDDLTGLANRASLMAEIDRAAARAGRSKTGFGLLFIDLDGFKSINDTRGHRTGDSILREVASCLRLATRTSDFVARNGGDEFVVLAEDAPDAETIVALAERIRDALSEPIEVAANSFTVSASFGVTWLPPGTAPNVDQLRDADLAMYRAKALGPGRIRVFDESLRTEFEERFALELALRDAVHAGELHTNVQPFVDLTTGEVVGAELLSRWTTADGSSVSPDVFVPVAESSDLVVDLGRWILEEAGRTLADWAVAGLDLPLSVNISGRHIDHPDVVDHVDDVLRRWAISPGSLVVEITETSLLPDLGASAHTLQRLRDLGVVVSVDDFGVGHSSLRYLRELPVEVVKIDRTIISGLGYPGADEVIVTMLTRLADVLGAQIVAEGIETEVQRVRARELGCGVGQGFLFARPMPVDRFAAWVSARSVEVLPGA